jgi:hypothetical protein
VDKSRQYLHHFLHASAIQAISDLYDKLDAQASVMLEGARKSVDLLGSSAVRGPMERRVDDALRHLAQAGEGTSGSERYIACDQITRESLLKELTSDSETTPHGLLNAGIGHAVTTEHREMLAKAMGAENVDHIRWLVASLGGEEGVHRLQAEPLERFLEGYQHAMDAHCNKKIERPLARKCNASTILAREARGALTKFYDTYFKPVRVENLSANSAGLASQTRLRRVLGSDRLRTMEREWLARIKEGATGADLIFKPPPGEPENAPSNAVLMYVAGQLQGLVNAVAPLASFRGPENRRQLVHRHVFFNINDGATLVRSVLLSLKKSGQIQHLKEHASPLNDPSRIECVQVAIGADLDMIIGEVEEREYAAAMDNMPGTPRGPTGEWDKAFNPHTTRSYQSVGLAWLKARQAERDSHDPLAGGQGETLLALAELDLGDSLWSGPPLFEWLVNRSGNVELLRQFEPIEGARPFDDQVLLMSEGGVGPRGIARFTDWLTGHYEDSNWTRELGEVFCDALTEVLWRDLQTWIMGDRDTGTPGVGFHDASTRLRDGARVYHEKAGAGRNLHAEHREAYQRQASGLLELGKHLEACAAGGSLTRPSWLQR